MRNTYLVLGATGRVGGQVARTLALAGHKVLGQTRRAGAAGSLQQAGILPVIADPRAPGALAEALLGVDAVFLGSADAPDQDRTEIALIDAACQAGVPRIVKLSAQSAGLEPPVSFGIQHSRAEQALRSSGMSFSILRPTFFQQSLLLFADDIRKGGKIIAPSGKGRIAMVDTRDVADCAVVAMTRTDGLPMTRTLTGPEAVSFAEVAQLLQARLSRKVRHLSPPSPVARLVLPMMTGMPRWQSSLIVDLLSAIKRGAQSQVSGDVESLLGRKPRSVAVFLDEHRSAFGA